MADSSNSAFPFNERTADGACWIGHPGLTIRDYFAGQALVGLYAAGPGALPATANELVYAKASYCIADAMLLARGEG